MALKLYNPKSKTFVAYTPSEGDLPLSELLLLNLLIEAQAQTQYFAALNPMVLNSPEELRSDVVTNL